MKKYTFILNFGYVESASLSFMPWSSSKMYRGAKDALIDLAHFFLEKYLKENKIDLKKCCLATSEKDQEALYCSKCRTSIEDQEFDEEDFIQWIIDMSQCDVDTFHGNFIDYNPEDRWQSNGMEGSPNQRFVYQAEWVIAAALGYPHQDISFEDICKTRTKKKQESFSYYG